MGTADGRPSDRVHGVTQVELHSAEHHRPHRNMGDGQHVPVCETQCPHCDVLQVSPLQPSPRTVAHQSSAPLLTLIEHPQPRAMSHDPRALSTESWALHHALRNTPDQHLSTQTLRPKLYILKPCTRLYGLKIDILDSVMTLIAGESSPSTAHLVRLGSGTPPPLHRDRVG